VGNVGGILGLGGTVKLAFDRVSSGRLSDLMTQPNKFGRGTLNHQIRMAPALQKKRERGAGLAYDGHDDPAMRLRGR
jgi:hypothetical protein